MVSSMAITDNPRGSHPTKEEIMTSALQSGTPADPNSSPTTDRDTLSTAVAPTSPDFNRSIPERRAGTPSWFR